MKPKTTIQKKNFLRSIACADEQTMKNNYSLLSDNNQVHKVNKL